MNYFTIKHREAVEALKARGFPVPAALDITDDPSPLSLTTRDDIGAWVAQHGGGEEETRLLEKAVGALVRTPPYVEALVTDAAVRISILDGAPHGLVSEMDRHSSALALHAKALRQKPPPVQDAAPAKPKPSSSQSPAAKAPPQPSPFRRDSAPVSEAEIARRKAALANGLKPRASNG
jgi:hypothetical protein